MRAPSLYRHITSQADLTRRNAALALTEVGEAIGAAIQGRAGRDALRAAAGALRDFVVAHPGRYAATVNVPQVPGDAQDPVAVAAARGLDQFRAVLRGYSIPADDEIHALRAMRSMFHGFATLQAAGGFQYSTEVDDSLEWLVALVDHGLRGMAGAQGHPFPGVALESVLPQPLVAPPPAR